MSCRRVSRELIELLRFGELDWRSVPHLDHLETCAACREEIGLDRELVLQLRRALRARVDGHAASPGAWLEIRRRALEPQPTWRARLLPVLRLAPVGAVVVLVVALMSPLGQLSPFGFDGTLASVPGGRGFTEAAVNDPVDPYRGRPWLRYVTPPPPSAPPTGVLAAVDPGERLIARAEPSSGPTQ